MIVDGLGGGIVKESEVTDIPAPRRVLIITRLMPALETPIVSHCCYVPEFQPIDNQPDSRDNKTVERQEKRWAEDLTEEIRRTVSKGFVEAGAAKWRWQIVPVLEPTLDK